MWYERCRTLAVAAVFAALAVPSAEAMIVVVQKGEVLVNRGDGFQAVMGSVEIAPGSTVVVQEGAAAEFVCSDSSRLAILPGYHPVPTDCATAAQAAPFELDTAGYLLIGAGVLGGAIAIIESTGGDDMAASAQ